MCQAAATMKPSEETTKAQLRALPSVEKLFASPTLSHLLRRYNRSYVTEKVRSTLAGLRQDIRSGTLTTSPGESEIADRVAHAIAQEDRSPFRTVVNATGTVLHTNLGRALLAKAALEEIVRVGSSPVTLEYDFTEAGRGDRDDVVEGGFAYPYRRRSGHGRQQQCRGRTTCVELACRREGRHCLTRRTGGDRWFLSHS